MLEVKVKTLSPNVSISLQEAKDWLKVDGTADDQLIEKLILQSRGLIESSLNITVDAGTVLEAMFTQREEIRVPYATEVSITSCEDEDGEPVEYTEGVDGVIKFKGSFETCKAVYMSGYSDVPTSLILGWLQVIGEMYENRAGDYSASLVRYNRNLQPLNRRTWI